MVGWFVSKLRKKRDFTVSNSCESVVLSAGEYVRAFSSGEDAGGQACEDGQSHGPPVLASSEAKLRFFRKG